MLTKQPHEKTPCLFWASRHTWAMKNELSSGKYSARITVDGDGWFVVSVCYNDGEGFAAVHGMGIKSFDTIAKAERYARKCIAKV